MGMNINQLTKEYLLEHGFSIRKLMGLTNTNNLDDRPVDAPYEFYKSKDRRVSIMRYRCTDTKGVYYTNSGREWFVQVDNPRHESIGCIEVDTIGQFERFLSLCDINIEYWDHEN